MTYYHKKRNPLTPFEKGGINIPPFLKGIRGFLTTSISTSMFYFYNRVRGFFFLCHFFFLFITSSLANIDVTTNIYSNDVLFHTNPRMYNGIFVEFLYDFVDGENGLWAQELLDRGFDYNMESNPEALKYWKITSEPGIDATQYIKLSKDMYNPNGVNSVLLLPTFGKSVRISQTIRICDSVGLNFYIYARSNNPSGSIRIFFTDEANSKEFFSQSISIKDTVWRKYEISIPALHKHGKINFHIANNGIDTVFIDEASLMPANNFMGIRYEYYLLFKKLNTGVFRYPGGWFADSPTNDWINSIEPMDKRNSPNVIWSSGFQRMDLGMFEYLEICRIMDIVPLLSVNFWAGTPESAANLVEFCNGSVDSKFGKIRADLGHSEPYNIKYFEVGNEMWNDRVPRYIKEVPAFYKSMKEKDSTIKLIADGNLWDVNSFKILTDNLKYDIFSYHPGAGIDAGVLDSLHYLAFLQGKTEMHIRYREDIIKSNLSGKVTVALTEWCSLHGSNGINFLDTGRLNRTFFSGFYSGMVFNFMARSSDFVDLGVRTFKVDFIASDTNKRGDRIIYGTYPYHLMNMVSHHIGNKVIRNSTSCDTYYLHATDGRPWINETPWVDITSTKSDDTVFVTAFNRYRDKKVNLKINMDFTPTKDSVSVYEYYSDDILTRSDPNFPEKTCITQYKLPNNSIYTLKEHSFTTFAFYYAKKIVIPQPEDTTSIQVNFAPNPFLQELAIQFNTIPIDEIEVKIFDFLGRLLFKEVKFILETNYYLNLRQLAQGPYLLQIKTGNMERTHLIYKYED
ncbi:MAG: hypothetical protein HW421_3448 [Ignavibacteria bacterium]|nr:hypothetical protein [Ignavibacteria bacterium]